MPEKSVRLNDFRPSVNALRESIRRTEEVLVLSYKQTTKALYPDGYGTAADVADPDRVLEPFTLKVEDVDGSETFPTVNAFMARLEREDWTSAHVMLSTSLPGGPGRWVLFLNFAGALSVELPDPSELDHVLSPVRVERDKWRKKSAAHTVPATLADDPQDASDSPSPKTHARRSNWWSRLSIAAKVVWGIVGGVIVVVLGAWVTNALGLTGN